MGLVAFQRFTETQQQRTNLIAMPAHASVELPILERVGTVEHLVDRVVEQDEFVSAELHAMKLSDDQHLVGQAGLEPARGRP